MRSLLACVLGLAALLVGGPGTATVAVLLTPLVAVACSLLAPAPDVELGRFER